MLKKLSLICIGLLSVTLLFGVAWADLETETVGPLSFFDSEGDLEVVGKATHPGMATGIQPSVEWVPCGDPEDGFKLQWDDPSPGEKWVISEVKVSAVNESDLYKYDVSWGDVENPSLFTEIPTDCFKAGGGSPTPPPPPEEIVNSWEVEVGACESCPPEPEADVVPVGNTCDEDYWTFSFDIESCDNLCSLDVTFDLDCDLCGEGELGIWELVSQDCEGCTWEFIGGEYVSEDISENCEPEYVCTLNWELTSSDYNFCELESRVFGIGPAPELPDEKVISGDIDGEIGYEITLTSCPEYEGDLPDLTVNVLDTETVAGLPGLDQDLLADEGVFFDVEFDPSSDGVCGVEVCFFVNETCEEFSDVGLYYLPVEGETWVEKEWTCSESTREGFISQVCFSFDATQIEDFENNTWGAGPDSLFSQSPSPGPTPDGEEDNGGGGCSVGGFTFSMLFLVIPMVLLGSKKF